MAYNRTNWTNREVEKPRTYTSVTNADGTITLTPAEGEVFSAGTPIIAENMNNIENQLVIFDRDWEILQGQRETKKDTYDAEKNLFKGITYNNLSGVRRFRSVIQDLKDANGNYTSRSLYIYDNLGALEKEIKFDLGYDTEGNLISETFNSVVLY